LEDAEKTIKDLFPGIRVIQAHGRMTRGMAEDNVAAFAEGMYDILLATTVIENGVDIPSVNTIVVQNAQAFGMSALYQLRGRVGRSSLQAYAYFLHKEEAITEQSALRLQAMADLCELGSGFDVANRDLEIRGAGSLLGTEQSGMAARVGFDLYMRMLKKSIRQLKGLDLPLVPRTNVLLPSGEGSLEIREGPSGVKSAFIIPSSYIEDKRERSRQEGIARLSESTNQLVQLTNEWKEKYGPLPPMLQEKMKTLHFHAVTRILGIDIVGIVQRVVDGEAECILRSPGLRPRHWTFISEALQQNVPKGLSVIFPNRFLCQYEDEEEDWDVLDQEEIEALKEISSASKIRDMDEIRIDDYPRFVVSNFERVPKGSRVDFLLKMLLPLSRIVHKKQQVDKETAKLASELRDKEESMKKAQESKGYYEF
jgi:transcription-repair coupling factor (superfamily II helicase)